MREIASRSKVIKLYARIQGIFVFKKMVSSVFNPSLKEHEVVPLS